MGLQRKRHFYIIGGKLYLTEKHSTELNRQSLTGDTLAADKKLTISTISLSRRPAQCYAIQTPIDIEAGKDQTGEREFIEPGQDAQRF